MMNIAHSVWRQYTGDRDAAVLFFVKVVVALCSHSSSPFSCYHRQHDYTMHEGKGLFGSQF